MIRNLLGVAVILIVYYALKTIFRTALKASREDGDAPARLRGEEMVFDPECRTHVIKDRAVTRRVRGTTHYFCSEACAQRYEEKQDG